MKRIEKPISGKPCGCNDGPAPTHSLDELSRLLDALFWAQEAGLDVLKVFILAPTSLCEEYSWSKWYYVPYSNQPTQRN
jgi:hypothetical protein